MDSPENRTPPLDKVRAQIALRIEAAYSPEIAAALEIGRTPPETAGDLALAAFPLARLLRRKPADIAQEIGKALAGTEGISRVDVVGPYVNLHLERGPVAAALCRAISDGTFFDVEQPIDARVVLEHTSINPNASPHVGRGRNAMIGDALARMLRFIGHDVDVRYYVNDMGKQIALLAIASRGKPDLAFDDLLHLYMEISARTKEDAQIEQEAFALLVRFEQGDESVRAEFRRVVDLCVAGQLAILHRLGASYDHFDYESSFIDEAALAPLLAALQAAGALFTDEHGRLVADLQKIGFDRPDGRYLVLRRGNGSSMYVLRDLSYNLFKAALGARLDLIVLGEDHRLYHQQLTAVIATVGVQAPEPIHYSFVLLREGKMSTRQGKVVLLSDFIDQATAKAAQRIREANDHLQDDDVARLAEIIAIGAVRYAILSVAPASNVTFDLEEALRFEGNTGPYVQYSCTRVQSILEKAGSPLPELPDEWRDVEQAEWSLIMALAEFQQTVRLAANARNPAAVCAYAFHVARQVSRFYHDCPVLTATGVLRARRLHLCRATSAVLSKTLELVGIGVPHRM